METEEYQPTGPEIDDARLDNTLLDDIKMGAWTAACTLWIAAAVIFLVGFAIGAVVGARMF